MADEGMSQEELDRVLAAFAEILEKKLSGNIDVDLNVEKMRLLVNERLDQAKQDPRNEIRDEVKLRIDSTEKQIATHYNFLKLTGTVVVLVAGGFATFFGITNKDSINSTVKTQVDDVIREKRREISKLQDQIKVELDSIKENNRDTGALLVVEKEKIRNSQDYYLSLLRIYTKNVNIELTSLEQLNKKNKKSAQEISESVNQARIKYKEISSLSASLQNIDNKIDAQLTVKTARKFTDFTLKLQSKLDNLTQINIRRQDLEMLTAGSQRAFQSSRVLSNFGKYSKPDKIKLLTYFANRRMPSFVLYPSNREILFPKLNDVLKETESKNNFPKLRLDIGLIYGMPEIIGEIRTRMEAGYVGVSESFADFERASNNVFKRRRGISLGILKEFRKEILNIALDKNSGDLRGKALSYIQAGFRIRSTSRIFDENSLIP